MAARQGNGMIRSTGNGTPFPTQQGEDYMVVPMGGKSPVEAMMGMTSKQPLSQTVGYVSGTPVADVFKEKMATGRAMMQAMANSGGGSQESETERALMQSQTGLNEERERMAQKERQGYGSANADLTSQRQLESALSEAEKGRQTQLDIANIYGGAKQNVADTDFAGDVVRELIKSPGKNGGYSISDIANSDEFKSLPQSLKDYFAQNADGIKKATGNRIIDLQGFIKELKEQATQDYMRGVFGK
jgi:hypothetical protein